MSVFLLYQKTITLLKINIVDKHLNHLVCRLKFPVKMMNALLFFLIKGSVEQIESCVPAAKITVALNILKLHSFISLATKGQKNERV